VIHYPIAEETGVPEKNDVSVLSSPPLNVILVYSYCITQFLRYGYRDQLFFNFWTFLMNIEIVIYIRKNILVHTN